MSNDHQFVRETIWMDAESGNDSNDGRPAAKIKTFARAGVIAGNRSHCAVFVVANGRVTRWRIHNGKLIKQWPPLAIDAVQDKRPS